MNADKLNKSRIKHILESEMASVYSSMIENTIIRRFNYCLNYTMSYDSPTGRLANVRL